MSIETITATAHSYTATLTGDRVEIHDADGVWAGTGRWDGHAIQDCAAVLGGCQERAEEIFDALDGALAAAATS